MARPKKPKTLQTVSIRLPTSMIEHVDGCAERLQQETPLLIVNRTDAIRYLLQIGLAEFEKKGAQRK
jgi:hypothetical protein